MMGIRLRRAVCAASLFTFAALVQAQEPKKPAANNPPDLRREIERTNEELAEVIRQQHEVIRGLNPFPQRNGQNPVALPVGVTPVSPKLHGGSGVTYSTYVVGQGRTGLCISTVPADLRETLKLEPDVGLYIYKVFADTPADGAGYRRDDVLVEFNSRPVPNDLAAFMGIVPFIKIGEMVKGTVLREGRRLEMPAMRLADRVIPVLPHTSDSLCTGCAPASMLPGTFTPPVRDPGFGSGILQSRAPVSGPAPRIPGYRVVRNGGITEIIAEAAPSPAVATTPPQTDSIRTAVIRPNR